MLNAYIPARGGSKRLVNKNLLPIDGEPLVVRAIRLALKVADKVYVSTDSDQIAQLAETHGAITLHRKPEWAGDDVTVDALIEELYRSNSPLSRDPLLVIQPTVIALELDYLLGVRRLIQSHHLTTVTLAKPAHNVWTPTRQIDERANAQDSTNFARQELGIRLYSPLDNGRPPGATRIVSGEWIDIDIPADYVAAKSLVEKKHIVFRYRERKEIGSGHRRRVEAIGDLLQHHHLSYHNLSGSAIHALDRPIHLIVNDILDTTEKEMAQLRATAPVIALEDLGPGAALANRTINALYADGSDWAILRPEFLSTPNKPIADRSIDVLVTFGGTDPANLTGRLDDVFESSGINRDFNVFYVQPPGQGGTPSRSMAALLSSSKMVFTSGGRTVFEAAACGTPAVVICQNLRETTHTHLGYGKGNLNLGHHPLVTRSRILALLPPNLAMLQEMSDVAYRSIDRKGLDRMVHLIEQTLKA